MKHYGPGFGPENLKDIDIIAILPMILPLIAVGTILILIALVDLYRHRETRNNVLIWTLIIVFVSLIGPVLYLTVGRKDVAGK